MSAYDRKSCGDCACVLNPVFVYWIHFCALIVLLQWAVTLISWHQCFGWHPDIYICFHYYLFGLYFVAIQNVQSTSWNPWVSDLYLYPQTKVGDILDLVSSRRRLRRSNFLVYVITQKIFFYILVKLSTVVKLVIRKIPIFRWPQTPNRKNVMATLKSKHEVLGP